MKEDADRDLVQAWWTIALFLQAWNKRLPDLRVLLQRGGHQQSVSEQRAALELLAQQTGIPLRQVRI